MLERTQLQKYGPAELSQRFMVMDTICDATQVRSCTACCLLCWAVQCRGGCRAHVCTPCCAGRPGLGPPAARCGVAQPAARSPLPASNLSPALD